MLNNDVFYHKALRRAIVAFGTVFSDIKIERRDNDGTLIQTISVPIAQAPKEKWILRVDADPTLDQHTYTTLPRLSFEITGIAYDPSRKVNRLNKIRSPIDSGSAQFVYSPVPYNLDISLYALTKTQEDGFQIVEQILPFFTPEFTISIKGIDELGTIIDIPVILNSVSQQDDYDGDFNTRRFITWTMNFTMKLNLYGPINDRGVITNVQVDVGNLTNIFVDPEQQNLYSAQGDVTDGSITDEWIDRSGDYADPEDPQTYDPTSPSDPYKPVDVDPDNIPVVLPPATDHNA